MKHTCLGHHASPCNNLCVNLLAGLLLMRLDGLEKTDEVFILRVVMFYELIEALGEVGPNRRVVVPSHRRVAQVELVVVVV